MEPGNSESEPYASALPWRALDPPTISVPPLGIDGDANGADADPDPVPGGGTAMEPGTAESQQPGSGAAGADGGSLVAELAALRSSVVERLAKVEDATRGLPDLAERVAEIARLRARDTDLIGRLHDDVTRLRGGELASALTPVVNAILKLHDMMVGLGAADDPNSVAGLLRTQLLQNLESTCGVAPFTPSAGEPFDPAKHTAVKRLPTAESGADMTIASTLKDGFVRNDGVVVRVAECEVHRYAGDPQR